MKSARSLLTGANITDRPFGNIYRVHECPVEYSRNFSALEDATKGRPP
ncbi:hypothetical protein ARUE_c33840 [Arthrobacter sp. Rue61a]|nr:hypothetical protein ARUE_c33840 [Arthrobacter sp. Rue61a]